VGYFKYQSSKQDEQLKGSKDSYAQNNINSDNQTMTQATPTQAAAVPALTPTPEVNNGQCVRNFDENKLKNDKIAIANRQVEMQVKDLGTIKLEFYEKDAPKTVENFLRLTNAGFYNCLTFHRVAKGFVIQGGDPSGNGTGGTSAFGEKFEDELNPETPSYKAGYVKGVLAMANSGPNTNGSQFFIMLDDVPLNHAYTIFGKVTVGQDVVDKIGQVDITPQMGPNDGAPKMPVVMTSVKIIK
jgi:cyclophilin family peptidyl-prolyl cis-trans isomerase